MTIDPTMPDVEPRLGCDERDTLIKIEALLEPLARCLNAPGDWGYGSTLADLTMNVKTTLHRVRRALADNVL